MTLLELLKSKSTVDHGTLVEIVQGIEQTIGQKIYVYLGGITTTNEISGNIEDEEFNGNVDIIEVSGNISDEYISGNSNIESIHGTIIDVY